MKRLIGSLTTLAAAAVVFAQAPFTIVRPADGAKVREKVHVLFPLDSIPSGGYVGIYLGGKFLEATVPPRGQKFIDYTIDTKKLGLQDGPLNVEAVLFVDFNEKPRIVDRSSITINIANHADINMPPQGIRFRYKFKAGTQWVYHYSSRVISNVMSLNEARNGGEGKRTESQQDSRLLYSIDNTYANGDALIRIQPIPEKGQSSALLTALGDPQPRRYYLNQLEPVYMRVRPTGMEVFGATPVYFPTMASPTQPAGPPMRMIFPLPTLPTDFQKPGQEWQTRFQLPAANPNPGSPTIVQQLPAMARFADLEWEMGHPCAKIHLDFSVGTPGNDANSVNEDIWYALDRNQVIKMQRSRSVETKVVGNPSSAATAAGRNGTGTFGQRTVSTTSGRNSGGITSNSVGLPDQRFMPTPTSLKQKGGNSGGGAGGLKDGVGLPSDDPGNDPANGGTGNGRNGGNAPTGPVNNLVRQTFQETIYLEG